MAMCAGELQVLLIDQKPFRRAGFLSLLENWAQSSNISVKAVAPDAAATDFEKLAGCNLVLLNLGSQSINKESTRQLMQLLRTLIPDTPLAIISDNTDPQEVALAVRSGASGFIPTTLKPSVALQSFTFIMKGGAYFPPSALLQKVEARECGPGTNGGRSGDGETEDKGTEHRAPCEEKGPGKSQTVRLTMRQQEVLEQLRLGKSNKVIAGALDMTEATVKVHVRQIMRKLGAANRTQVAVQAVEAGLNGTLAANGTDGSENVKSEPDPHHSQGIRGTLFGSA